MSHHPQKFTLECDFGFPLEVMGGTLREQEKTMVSVRNFKDAFPGCHVIANSVIFVAPSEGERGAAKRHKANGIFITESGTVLMQLGNSRTFSLSSAQGLRISALVRIIVKSHLRLSFRGLGRETLQSCKYVYGGSLHKTLSLPALFLGDFLWWNWVF